MTDATEESNDSATWDGELDVDGVPHGKGRMIYTPSGDDADDEQQSEVFEGILEHGRRQGHGVYKWKDGCIYDGNYEQNLRVGNGEMTFPDGSRYQGEFVGDRFNGHGVYLFNNGDVYNGHWVNGKRHGRGTYLCKSSCCQYEGKWADGGFIDGRLLFMDGSTYDGRFRESIPEGPGRFSFVSSGMTQTGAFIQGIWTTTMPSASQETDTINEESDEVSTTD